MFSHSPFQVSQPWATPREAFQVCGDSGWPPNPRVPLSSPQFPWLTKNTSSSPTTQHRSRRGTSRGANSSQNFLDKRNAAKSAVKSLAPRVQAKLLARALARAQVYVSNSLETSALPVAATGWHGQKRTTSFNSNMALGLYTQSFRDVLKTFLRVPYRERFDLSSLIR